MSERASGCPLKTFHRREKNGSRGTKLDHGNLLIFRYYFCGRFFFILKWKFVKLYSARPNTAIQGWNQFLIFIFIKKKNGHSTVPRQEHTLVCRLQCATYILQLLRHRSRFLSHEVLRARNSVNFSIELKQRHVSTETSLKKHNELIIKTVMSLHIFSRIW